MGRGGCGPQDHAMTLQGQHARGEVPQAAPARRVAPSRAASVRITVQRENAWPGGESEELSVVVDGRATAREVGRVASRRVRAGVDVVVLETKLPSEEGAIVPARFLVADAARRRTRMMLRIAHALRKAGRAEHAAPDAVSIAAPRRPSRNTV